MFELNLRKIHNKYYLTMGSGITYEYGTTNMVKNQPRNLGTKTYFNTYMFKPNRKILALVSSRPYLKEIVLLSIDYLESKFGKDRKNLFRLAYILSGMYGADLIKTIIKQAISICFDPEDAGTEVAVVEKIIGTIDMGEKTKFNLGKDVCLPFASNIFLEPWTKEYYSNLVQQYDRNMFYIHLVDSMASMEKYAILDTTLSWAHCNEGADVWLDRNRKFMNKYA